MSSPPEKDSDKKVKGMRTYRVVIKRRESWPLPNLQLEPQPPPPPRAISLPPPVIKTGSSPTSVSEKDSDKKVKGTRTHRGVARRGGSWPHADLQLEPQPPSAPRAISLPSPVINTNSSSTTASHDVVWAAGILFDMSRSSNDTSQRTGSVFRCKICNAEFNSRQALGGHSKGCRKRNLESDSRKAESSTGPATTSNSIFPNSDDVTNIKIATQANLPVMRAPVLAEDDGFNGSAPQQIEGEQEPEGGLVQQQPNRGFLDLNLNLPPPPDQDDKMDQPPAAQPHHADHDPTI